MYKWIKSCCLFRFWTELEGDYFGSTSIMRCFVRCFGCDKVFHHQMLLKVSFYSLDVLKNTRKRVFYICAFPPNILCRVISALFLFSRLIFVLFLRIFFFSHFHSYALILFCTADHFSFSERVLSFRFYWLTQRGTSDVLSWRHSLVWFCRLCLRLGFSVCSLFVRAHEWLDCLSSNVCVVWTL